MCEIEKQDFWFAKNFSLCSLEENVFCMNPGINLNLHYHNSYFWADLGPLLYVNVFLEN